MIDGESLRQIVDKFKEEQMSVVSFLADGNAKSYEQYRELCGQIRGLDVAITTITELAKRIEDDDD